MALGLAACGGSGGGDSSSPAGNNGSGAAGNTDHQGNGDNGSHSGNGDNGGNAGNGGNSGNGSNGGNGGNAGNGGNGDNGGSTAQAPATPKLSALRAGDHINFSWNNVGASSYTLYYSRQEITAQNLQAAAGKFTQLTGTKTTISPTTADSDGKHVQLAGRYYFALQAANGTATSAPSANVVAGLGFVNETNIDKCGIAYFAEQRWDFGSNSEDCSHNKSPDPHKSSNPIPKGQDGHIGTGKNGSKHMSMTTIKTPNGEQCVQDERTGLMWEVKESSLDTLRAATHTYFWYNPDPKTNGGHKGVNRTVGSCTNMPYGRTCNTSDFVATVNEKTLCGFSDWRIPTAKELLSISDFSRSNPASDRTYFPNVQTGNNSMYWSSTSSVNHYHYAYAVYSGSSGGMGLPPKGWQLYIRLVRDGK